AFAAGSKRYELRTRRPAVSAGDLVLIYETAPTSAIVAEAIVGDIRDSLPSMIWHELGPVLGVTREQFGDYYRDRERAIAIELRLSWLGRPVKLPTGMAPPQSW